MILSCTVQIDIETINFYSDIKYRITILERENEECFYCLKNLNDESLVLDHLTSQMNGGNNSYRNIVAVCHECNSKKSGKNGEDFVRSLYREGILNQDDLVKRLAIIEQVRNGVIKPEL